MPTFDDRQKGFESKFARDEELRFKATSRRNRLLGQWAAEKLGKTGEAADAYTREVIRADMQEAGDEDVVRKLRGDFEQAGVQQSDDEIRRTMHQLMAQAVEQIEANG
jgi:hypothetical protein